MKDLRHAWRMIGRMPVFAAVVILSLAAGIGVNTVVFSWVQARILEPIPGVSGSADFQLVETRTEHGVYPGVSWPEYRDLREGMRSFDGVIAFRMAPLYVGEPGVTERAYGLLVSDNYFTALGLRPAVGRFPTPHEMSPAGEAVAVISHDFWRTRFAGDPQVTTRSVRVNGRRLAIAGVTPEGFQGTVLGLTFDVWLPAALSSGAWRDLEGRGSRGFAVMGKLGAGASRAQAQRELDLLMARLANDFPQTNATIRGEVLPLWDAPRGPQRMLTVAVVLLQVIMLLLLLAVCGNTANLVLARASARHREMSIRLALGATPLRIARLLVAENMLLALVGAALGAVVAVWGTEALRAVPLFRGLPVRFQTSIDSTGVLFALTLGVLSGLIVAVVPATQIARVAPNTAFRSGTAPMGRSRLRLALMGVQVAVAIVVLVAAAIFFRNFMETRSIDPGFRREGVLIAAYDFAGRDATDASLRTFAAQLLDRLHRLPAVESAAIATSVPLDIHGLPTRSFAVEGHTRPDADPEQALSNTVTPGYFDVMGIELVGGSRFADLNDPSAPPQAIVNEEFVRRFVAQREPLGRWVEVRGRRYPIVGIVRNSLSNAFGEPPTPVIYLAYRDRPTGSGEIHVAVRGGSETALAADVRRIVRELDPELPLFNVRTMTEHIDANLMFRKIPARMFIVLGPMLLLLTSIGIYAVVAYAVSLRTTEIGVRLALGATIQRVIANLVGESLTVVAAGALIGTAVAFLVAVMLSGGRVDSLIFVAVPMILLAVAAIASWLPARRAAKLDPIAALKHE